MPTFSRQQEVREEAAKWIAITTISGLMLQEGCRRWNFREAKKIASSSLCAPLRFGYAFAPLRTEGRTNYNYMKECLLLFCTKNGELTVPSMYSFTMPVNIRHGSI